MIFEVYPRSQHRHTAWRNGGGSTWEVATGACAGAPDFAWRLSFAEVVTSGPFSFFPGVDRIITLVEGDHLELSLDTSVHRLEPYVPFSFAGETRVTAAVDRPSVDFNVMVDRALCTVTARTHRLTEHDAPLVVPAGGDVFIAVLEGVAGVERDPRPVDLQPRDVVRASGLDLRVHGAGVVQVTRVLPRRADV